MKKKLPVIIGILCTIAFSIWFGFTDKTHKIYDNNVNTATYASLGVFLPQWSLTQDFLCEEDTINALLIKSDKAGDFENAVVHLTVTDAETEPPTEEQTAPPLELETDPPAVVDEPVEEMTAPPAPVIPE